MALNAVSQFEVGTPLEEFKANTNLCTRRLPDGSSECILQGVSSGVAGNNRLADPKVTEDYLA